MNIQWPKHEVSLHLTHNQHKSYYFNVEYAITQGEFGYDAWVNEEQKQKAVTTNECWMLQWYPDTPVGFIVLMACDLDVLLAYAAEIK